MIRLIPRLTAPAYALRLRADLLAEKGQWLLIGEDETVTVLSDVEVRALYKREDEKGKSPPKAETISTRSRVVRVQHKSFTLEYEGKNLKIGAQTVRVLAAATKLGKMKFHSKDLKPFLGEPDFTQCTARLEDARKIGLIESLGKDRGLVVWTLTNNGRYIVNALATQAEPYAIKNPL